LLTGSKALDEYLKSHSSSTTEQSIDWLYLTTLSRPAASEERDEARNYVDSMDDKSAAYVGVLWMLVNRSEYLFVR
jgi:hypothetical protein